MKRIVKKREVFRVPVEPAVMQWLRSISGWTLVEVSKRLGVRKDTYLKMERGEKKPTIRQVKILAKAFHRPIATFLLPAPPKEPPLPIVCKLRLDMFEFYYEQNPSAKQHGHG
jgi:transcriptional regulator with XRE-family HTH domain